MNLVPEIVDEPVEGQANIVTSYAVERILRLQLLPTIQAWYKPGVSVLPKAKKGRALLALVALSEGKTISRVRAAAMLWSSLERTAALSRLRNTLHNIQRGFSEAGLDPLFVDDETIAFKLDSFLLDIEHGALSDIDGIASDQPFLLELEGLDPAFDRWLTRTRDDRLQRSPSRRAAATIETPGISRGLGGRPRLAVTEIEGVGLSAQEPSARALTEEVGNALARTRWFETTTRSPRGDRLSAGSDEVSEIADYLLVGTLQFDQGCYRLLLKLLDVNNSASIVWVGSFEEPTAGAFTVQRKLAHIVAARLDTDLLLIEADRRRLLPRQKNDAYTLTLLAVPAIYRLDRDPFLGAGHILEEAIAADQESALAHSWLAYWNMFLIGQGWAANPYQSMAQAGKAAERAMMLDPWDARAVTIAGHVKAFLGGYLDEAASLHQLAIKINPALALAWHMYSVTHAYAGRLDDALECILHCLELAPNDPHGFYAEGALGIVKLLRGEYSEAAAVGRAVTERHPQFSSAYKSYLAALGHLGRKSEADNALKRLRTLEPKFSLQRFRASSHYRRAEDLERFMTGLRLAGVT